jgi:hypothetical protein
MRAQPSALLVALLALAAGALAFRTWASPAPVSPEEMGAFVFAAGELVEDFRFKVVTGERGRLSELLEDHAAVVVVVRSVACPVSQKYGHELARLAKEYGQKGIAFLYLDLNPQDGKEEMRREIENFGFTGPCVPDPDAVIGRKLQVRVSTEVFVIDGARTLRYRGAVDDQYGITFAKREPRERWLRDALDAVLARRLARCYGAGCAATNLSRGHWQAPAQRGVGQVRAALHPEWYGYNRPEYGRPRVRR